MTNNKKAMEANAKKILIVEDDVNMRETLVHRFASERFEVLSAADGSFGLTLALKGRPDIILLDIMMPELDGMTLMKKLREFNDWGKHVPIIMLTSLKPDDRIMQGVARDEPAYYVMKDNFSLSGVVDKVKERLERVE